MTDDVKEPEKPNPKHVRLDFYRLALDWVYLRHQLPKPVAQDNGRRSAYREYGHPAETASDKAAQIAGMFHDWHDMVAENRREKLPAPHAAEEVTVVRAWKYLEPRFEQLVDMVEPEALREVVTVHREIRRSFGFNNPKQVLPVPCPGCELKTLIRSIAVGRDYISCAKCGYTVLETNYAWLVRVALDTLIESA